MLDVESAKETFRHHLRENGQRYTPERELILETVLGTEHHFSAETLAHEIKRLKGEAATC
jgi:Fe2+ or Zn2+ uptake regulation protein